MTRPTLWGYPVDVSEHKRAVNVYRRFEPAAYEATPEEKEHSRQSFGRARRIALACVKAGIYGEPMPAEAISHPIFDSYYRTGCALGRRIDASPIAVGD